MNAKERIKAGIQATADCVLLPVMALAALVARPWTPAIDVGLGPEPLINHVHHAEALRRRGYRVETFVDHVYYITDRFDRILRLPGPLHYLGHHLLLVWCVFRYRAVYLSFHGSALGYTRVAWRFEPWLLRLAGVKTVLLPYGSDVQDMRICPNPRFREALALDYPEQAGRAERIGQKIRLWTKHGDHVIGGCDWVDYLPAWNTLMLAHFAIDTDAWQPVPAPAGEPGVDRPVRLLHAPNHRNVKGTACFQEAVEALQAEGLPVELVLLERASNERVREAIAGVDVVADQLVVGWYAMFALEAMALGKPVLCHLRPDLLRFYREQGLLDGDEPPIVDCSPETVKEAIRRLVREAKQLPEIGRASRHFVERHHSLDAIGDVLDRINRSIGVPPRA